MEFKNLTPFDALAYSSVDKQDRRYHVVAMSVGYQLQNEGDADPAREASKSDLYTAHVMDKEPLPLCLADEHWQEPVSTSLVRESDLAPFKPRCDVVVTGHAYASQASQLFEVSLQVAQGRQMVIDKMLQVHGPRTLVRDGGLAALLRQGLNPSKAYSLGVAQHTQQVALRYELAYGGASVVAHPKSGQDKQGQANQAEHLMNEVCYRNPLGAGWMAQGYLQALAQTVQGLPARLRAPQIMRAGQHFEHLVQNAQSGAMDAKQMAQLDYKLEVAGLGPLNKAWAPRLALAGTYDEDWQKNRQPGLPKDFDFGYWNGAPKDQQIAWPDLTKGVGIRTRNLKAGGGVMQVTLPAHRAFVLLRMTDGLMLPHPMVIDTVELDTDTLQLRMVWRTLVPQDFDIRVMEARFEVDPQAPLLKLGGVQKTGVPA